MSYYISTEKFEASHGKKPRGRGLWAFIFGWSDTPEFPASGEMTYSEAVKWAKRAAKIKGTTFIQVAP